MSTWTSTDRRDQQWKASPRESADTKLYIITRADLPHGLAAAQCAHATIEAALSWPDMIRQWHDASNNIVILQAPDEDALHHLNQLAQTPHVAIREPDLGSGYGDPGPLTAIAFAIVPGAARLLGDLPLFAKEVANA